MSQDHQRNIDLAANRGYRAGISTAAGRGPSTFEEATKYWHPENLVEVRQAFEAAFIQGLNKFDVEKNRFRFERILRDCPRNKDPMTTARNRIYDWNVIDVLGNDLVAVFYKSGVKRQYYLTDAIGENIKDNSYPVSVGSQDDFLLATIQYHHLIPRPRDIEERLEARRVKKEKDRAEKIARVTLGVKQDHAEALYNLLVRIFVAPEDDLTLWDAKNASRELVEKIDEQTEKEIEDPEF